MFGDKNSGVRATSVRVLTKLLRKVKSLPIQELALFPEYLIPGLETLLSESSEENVLLAMAESLPQLAQTAKFFLELAHAERTLLAQQKNSKQPSYKVPAFDLSLKKLHDSVEGLLKILIFSNSIVVKQQVLRESPRLCLFFGRERTDSILIPLLFSYLNDPAWELRAALFSQLPSVFMFVPSSSFLDLNIFVKFLTDCQEEVSQSVLKCSIVMLQQFRFRQSSVLELAKHVVQILIHPSNALRHGARRVLTQIARLFSDIDVDVLLVPLIMPYFKEQSKFRDVYYASANLRLKERLIPESEVLSPVPHDIFQRTLQSIVRPSVAKSFRWTVRLSKRTLENEERLEKKLGLLKNHMNAVKQSLSKYSVSTRIEDRRVVRAPQHMLRVRISFISLSLPLRKYNKENKSTKYKTTRHEYRYQTNITKQV